MNHPGRIQQFFGLAVACILLAACGGGSDPVPDTGSNPPPTGGIDRGGISFGAITAFGSVVVNGVHFDTTSATFMVNGAAGTQADLQVGQVVLVTGTVNDDGVTGTAEKVEYEDEAKGPVESVDAAAGTFSVLGTLVRTDLETLYAGFLDFADLAAAAAQAPVIVEVSGFRDSTGAVRATRIERRMDGIEFEVRGVVSGLDTAASTFMIGTLTVDFSAALLPEGVPAEGAFVEARGTRSGDVLAASRVHVEGEIDEGLQDGDRAEVEGFVTRIMDAMRFEIGGVEVVIDAGTQFEGGTAMDLMLNSRVEAQGSFDQAAGVLRATKISIRQSGNYELDGMVQAITSGGFRAVGVDVTVNMRTTYKDDRDDDRYFSFDRLSAGDFVEVRGGPGMGDAFVAYVIERGEAESGSTIQGPARDIDANAGTFTLFGVTVDTSSVEAGGFRDAQEQSIGRQAFFDALAPGGLVKAEGSFDGASTLTAREVQLEN